MYKNLIRNLFIAFASDIMQISNTCKIMTDIDDEYLICPLQVFWCQYEGLYKLFCLSRSEESVLFLESEVINCLTNEQSNASTEQDRRTKRPQYTNY